MGKALEDRADFDRAFSYMSAANAVRRSKGLQSFDIAAAERLMAATAERFTGPLLQRLEGAGPASDRPVFIVGMPRSGTSLVEQILSAHPAVQRRRGNAPIWASWSPRSGGRTGRPIPRGNAASDRRGLQRVSARPIWTGLPSGAPGQTRVI